MEPDKKSGQLLPLLIFLPGMRRDNLRSYIWLCFICLALLSPAVSLAGNETGKPPSGEETQEPDCD